MTEPTSLRARRGELYPWLEATMARLWAQHQSGRLPHAILFSGPEGIGKTDLAYHLASMLLCQEPLANMPCGRCGACALLDGGSHPNLFLLEPPYQAEGKGSKAILIDRIRELVPWTAETGQRRGCKVVFAMPAEAMNVNAANALLKCLEEPADETYFLLVTHSSSRLLATVRSRCQEVDVTTPRTHEARTWLATALDRQDSKADPDVLLRLCHGRPLQALDYATSGYPELKVELTATLDDLLSGAQTPVSVASRLTAAEPVLVLDLLYAHLQEAVQAALAHESPDRPRVGRLFLLVDEIVSEKAAMLSAGNPNPQLLLESVLVSLKSALR